MERLKAALVALVCASLLSPPGVALAGPLTAETAPSPASQSQKHARAPYEPGQLHGDERILHALNRFTFGTRPGDLEAVRAMGLEKWLEQQLHPETLDETDLNARLAEFPAMQQTPEELLYRLPSNAVIRQVVDGKAPVPQAPALQVIYQNEMARVELNRQKRAQEKQEQASVSTNVSMGITTAAPAPNSIPDATTAMSSMMSSPMDESVKSNMSSQPTPAQSDQASGMVAQAKPEALRTNQDVQSDPALSAEILALAPKPRLIRLARMQQPEFDSFFKALKPQQRFALYGDLTPPQKEFVAALENPERVVAGELAYQRLIRDIYSNAQLQEVMTDFWLNHFNVYLRKNEATPYYLVSFERDVIRPLALGKFEDLLEATAHSPAMLLYLDNATSMGPDSPAAERAKERDARNPDAKRKAPEGLNENYARELMELHTLGVNGGYTQADVTQVARVLTGWTVDRPQRGGGFRFDENRHEPGTKKVLGKKIKESGEKEGEELLHMLAMRPATAQFLSRKLAIRFVGDEPPQSLVDRMAKTYLSSGGDISEVLKTLFHSPEFWATDVYRAKVKTPIEYVVSAARASNAVMVSPLPLVNALRDMGMPLYGAVPPTGYKWESSTWVSTGALVNRMNFALTLAANKLPGITVAWPEQAASWTGMQAAQQPASQDGSQFSLVHNVAADTAVTPETEERRLESLLVAGGVSESTRAAVLQQFEAQATEQQPAPYQAAPYQQMDNVASSTPMAAAAKPVSPAQAAAALTRQDQLLAGLLLGSPEFQRR
jgi:uncharacterized protein (DUF1800 family)